MTVSTSPASLADAIDDVLPQTQCTKCGYAGCRPYAEAIASGAAEINQCPPGGATGIDTLARLLNRSPKPLNPANGVERSCMVAVIDESLCIGCTLCIVACPVDCIVGASKRMHTVIASQCTGCDLCIAPCPMDCIAMMPAAQREWTRADADGARRRYGERNARRERERAHDDARLASKALAKVAESGTHGGLSAAGHSNRKTAVDAAIARARARRAASSDPPR